VVVPTGVFAATEDFAGHDLDSRVTRAAGELALLMGKVSSVDSAVSVRRTTQDEFAEPTPFEQLLRQASGR
jgi:FMN reductase